MPAGAVLGAIEGAFKGAAFAASLGGASAVVGTGIHYGYKNYIKSNQDTALGTIEDAKNYPKSALCS